jgi:hypothetical protein
MRITKPTAIRAAGLLNMFETPEAAMRQVFVQLEAIRPHRDHELSRVADVLCHVARFEGDRRDRLIAQLKTAAQ